MEVDKWGIYNSLQWISDTHFAIGRLKPTFLLEGIEEIDYILDLIKKDIHDGSGT